MKTFKMTIMLFGILAFVACKDSEKRDVEDGEVAVETSDYSVDNSMDNTMDVNDGDAVIADDPYNAFDTDNMDDMYDGLAMSQEQINNFESDFNKKIQDMKTVDNTTSLDLTKLQQEKDQSLKAVLSVEQYKNYDQWKKDNVMMR